MSERTINPDVLALARSYHAANKETLGLPEWSDTGATIKADSDLGKRAGAAFEGMKHEPNDPSVREAYEALKKETLAQYHHAVKAGYTFTPWTKPGQPYTDSADMMRDVRENKHLHYFPTDAGFGTDTRFHDHPLYDKTPEGVRFNDLFRAVHDLYAHAQHGHQFGPTGELRAWVEHARMFSPLARKALTTETHGQNSWVNFGPHEPWKTPQTERPFADQKAGVLPEAVHPPVKLARAYTLGAGEPLMGGQDFMHTIHDETGTRVGHVWVTPRENGTVLHVNHIGAAGHEPNATGLSGVRGIVRQLKALYPQMTRLTGTRVSGRREGNAVSAPVKLARQEDRVAEDIRAYRSQVRPGLTAPGYKRPFALNGPEEHGLMHTFFTNRGLKVVKGTYTSYDPDTHTFTHPTPEDKPAVARSYIQWADTPVKLSRAEDEDSFHAALDANPDDHITRLVFADWLEDHGDPRAEGYRALGTMRKTPHFFGGLYMYHAHAGDGIQHQLPVDWVSDISRRYYRTRREAEDDIAERFGRLPPDRQHNITHPVKLARNEMKQVGTGGANRQLGSDNHAKRVELAQRVLAEAGLTQARVSAVLAHSGPRGARPAVAVMLAEAHPKVAKFAAAWMGLLTGQHALTVFHPGEGEDTLHIVDSPHPTDHVGEYLRRAGVPQFTVEKRGSGTRAYVVNPMKLMDVDTAARGLGGSVQSVQGSAVRLGASGEADARAAFRTVIDDAEKEAGL